MPLPTRIRSGPLRHRIQILDIDPGVYDTTGEPSSSGTPFGPPVWARVESLSGRELESAQQINSQITHRITMRWQRGIRATQSVLFGDRYFRVEAAINPNEQNKILYLFCIERNDSARDSGGTAAQLE